MARTRKNESNEVREQQQEARQAGVERREASVVRTSDTNDPSRGWTAQQGAMPRSDADTRQKYAEWQMPVEEVEADVRGQNLPTSREVLRGKGQVLDGDEALSHPFGLEPDEAVRREAQQKVRGAVADSEDVDQDRTAAVGAGKQDRAQDANDKNENNDKNNK